jgi:hypothetical protein
MSEEQPLPIDSDLLGAFRDETTGLVTIMPFAEREDFICFRETMLKELTPEGFMEHLLATGIVHDTWHCNRLRHMQYFEHTPALYAILSGKQSILDQRTRRYLKLQARRRAQRLREHATRAREQARRDKELDKAAALAQLNRSRGETYNPDYDFPPGIGFVFSIQEIELRILRNLRLKQGRLLSRKRTVSEPPPPRFRNRS